MAKLKTCRVCGGEIASSARRCPHCGARNRRPLLKRPLFWIFVLIVFFLLWESGILEDAMKSLGISEMIERPAATPTPAPTATPVPTPEITYEDDEITPKFKKKMDSFEADMDKYVAYVDSYIKDGLPTKKAKKLETMQEDCEEKLSTMEDLIFEDAYEDIPEADEWYYYRVLDRVEEKLWDAEQRLSDAEWEKEMKAGYEDEEEKDTAPVSAAKSKGSSVTPEFKEAIDAYEDFFDEYIEFMKKYEKSSDQGAMMKDYLSFTVKYADAMEAMNKLGDKNMSDADEKYYIEAMARIEQKLIKASLT